MTINQIMHDTLLKQMRQTRAAYYQGVPGITYEDMRAAATRVLEMRAAIERERNPKAKAKAITAAAISNLLRAG